MRRRLLLLACCVIGLSAAQAPPVSPYLLLFAGDGDNKDSDFYAVMDVRPGSKTIGEVVSTLPLGQPMTMPHHMEYSLPPKGEWLFSNAHHAEKSLLIDVSNPRALHIAKTFDPPAPFRYPHDYYRTPTGTRLVGFLRSEGASPDHDEKITPGNHGGIAEYSADGRLIRTASAAVPGMTKPVRPYAFALLPSLDRLVVTSAPMMEDSSADVVQVYRYSDLKLLKTLDLLPGQANGRVIDGSQRAGFGPRVLPDGSVFLNSYGCAFYHLTDIAADTPRLAAVFALETPEPQNGAQIRGSCGIPIVFDHYWLMPVGQLHAVVVLDITDPARPHEVSRLATPPAFNPHWLARDPVSNRLVLGAELGGEQGMFVLRFDSSAGRLSLDDALKGDGQTGYVSLENQHWPHGNTGPAWAHAALFLPEQ